MTRYFSRHVLFRAKESPLNQASSLSGTSFLTQPIKAGSKRLRNREMEARIATRLYPRPGHRNAQRALHPRGLLTGTGPAPRHFKDDDCKSTPQN